MTKEYRVYYTLYDDSADAYVDTEERVYAESPEEAIQIIKQSENPEIFGMIDFITQNDEVVWDYKQNLSSQEI